MFSTSMMASLMLRCRAMGESFWIRLNHPMPSPLEMDRQGRMPVPPVRTLQQGY